jgi:hypothetical protein
MEQWNGFARLQAIAEPFRFIEEVAKHADELEKEDDTKGLWYIRINGVSAEGVGNKIPCIKSIRMLMGWGLADSKNSFEALPGSGHELSKSRDLHGDAYSIWTHAFSSQESVMDSPEYKEMVSNKHFFRMEVTRMPIGTIPCKPFNMK